MAVTHLVLWRVRGASEAERRANAQRVCDAFRTLRGQVPGLLRLEVGIDESGVDYACDVGLFTVFSDAAALMAYATHPEHLRVRDELQGVRTERYQVDFQT